MRIEVNSPKRRSEEVEKSLGVSLSHIYTNLLYGERTLLLGKTTDSDGGGVADILAGELNNVVSHFCLIFIVNCCLHSQSNELW